jgi:hypothetical protein
MPKPELDDEWKARVRGVLKAEIARRGIKYKDLSATLEELYGVKESPQNLSNKIARGTFTAIFMFQVLEAIGCQTITLEASQ